MFEKCGLITYKVNYIVIIINEQSHFYYPIKIIIRFVGPKLTYFNYCFLPIFNPLNGEITF